MCDLGSPVAVRGCNDLLFVRQGSEARFPPRDTVVDRRVDADKEDEHDGCSRLDPVHDADGKPPPGAVPAVRGKVSTHFFSKVYIGIEIPMFHAKMTRRAKTWA